MKTISNPIKIFLFTSSIVFGIGCTKLDYNLKSTFTDSQAAVALGTAGVQLYLNGAYADLAAPLTNQDNVFSLEENSTDESLVPTRGGDWDDNGVWRVVHNHTWTADHSQVLNVFNNLNKVNYDATFVLGLQASKEQIAEAKFVRAIALYYLLDLYGQFPVRNPGENLLNPPKVYSGADASNYIINELTTALPDVDPKNGPGLANPTAINTLLMHCYLQRGAWANPTKPTFSDADMQKVISIGTDIMNSGKFFLSTNYWDNFSVDGKTKQTEKIFIYPNTTGQATNNSGVQARYLDGLHYNSYGQPATATTPAVAPYGGAGWNGFSTMSDFYNTFNPDQVANPLVYGPADTLVDTRIGGRYTPLLTEYSGLRLGLLVGQQYDENGKKRVDRKGNPLAFEPVIASDMKETGNNLEVTGIRVVKYKPDFFDDPSGKLWENNPVGLDLVIFRYADVMLMVAEAKLRATSPDIGGATNIINSIRTIRGASQFSTVSLNSSIVDDPANPNTIIAERGRELYTESFRRTDLIRFGLFNTIWQYKPTDDPKYLWFPIPNQALAANPNLKQNPGY